MNAYMTITVRMLTAQALAQMKAMNAGLSGLDTGMARSTRTAAAFNRQMAGMNMLKWGSQMQWVGRQMSQNFTLPLVAAGVIASKWALENEKAFVRVSKVYGNASMSATVMKNELHALNGAFVALSNRFGIAQADAINIAGDWAAAGASGVALARAVELTMKTMVLGEIDAKKATEGLIAIQAQYGLSTKQLTATIEQLNMIENQTGISLAGLIDGFSRASGVARSAGVSTLQLAAMLAALTPAAGSAAQAGNALKTIISRLLSPTQEAGQILNEMGIHVTDLSWKSATADQRLQILSKSFGKLASAQKAQVSASIASRYQINKFDVLMTALNNDLSYYYQALNTASNATRNHAQAEKELQKVLDSSPKRLEIIWTIFKNTAADVGAKLVPSILMIANSLRLVFQWFNNLDPSLRKFLLAAGLILIVLGPIIRYMAALVQAMAILRIAAASAGASMITLGKAFMTVLLLPLRPFILAATTATKIIVSLVTVMMVQINAAVTAGTALLAANWMKGWFLLASVVPKSMAVVTAGFTRSMFLVITGVAAAMETVKKIFVVAFLTMRAGAIGFAVTFGAIMRSLPVLMSVVGSIMSGVMWRTFIGMITAAQVMATKIRPLLASAAVALTGPWGIAIAAIVLIFVALYNDIKEVVKSIVTYFQTGVEGIGSSGSFLVKMFWNIVDGIRRAFFSLPEGVQNALIAVIRIVRTAAMKVYEFMSYMNPFARHSPSLVENVTAGMQEVGRQFGLAVPIIEGHTKAAHAAVLRFGQATRTLIDGVNMAELNDKRIDIAKYIPSAVAQFDGLVRILKGLKADLLAVEHRVDAQKAVVDRWKASLDAANAALDRQELSLRKLRDAADAIQNDLDKAKATLQAFADAPIAGQGAIGDAIFANEMAQKKLRLEMMKMEDVVGPLDKLEGKLNSLNGAIELVRGEQTDLRQAGAGSEILKGYDEQIKALEGQKKAIDDIAAPLKKMKDELDNLARKGEELDLENSLKFDPLRRQIDAVTNSMKELPFDQILAGVKANKAEVDRLQKAYDAASKAVQNQEAVVNSLRATRDAIQASYDTEAGKLQKLEDEYSNVKDAISEVEGALNDAGQAAENMRRRLSREYITPGLQNFRDAAGGNFPDPGGAAGIGREGGLGDQSKEIEAFTKQMQDDLNKSLDSLNPFNWIKDKWNKFTGWWRDTVVPWWRGLFGGISIDTSKFEWLGKIWEGIKKFGSAVNNIASMLGRLFRPELARIIEVGKKLWAELQTELGPAISDLMKTLKQAWQDMEPFREGFMAAAKVVLAVFGAALLFIIKAVLPAVINGLHALISGIISIVKGIIQIFTGFVKFLTGVFTGDWRKAWDGIKDIFKGIWNIIVGIFKGTVGVIWGVIRGLVEGIVGFFKWLYDELVGHSIIPDLVKAIVTWMKGLPKKVIDAIASLLGMMGGWARNVWNNAWNEMKARWNLVVGWLRTIPGLAISAVQSLIDRLTGVGRNAFTGLYNTVTGLWNGPIMTFLKSIPGRAASSMAGIGNAVANAVKGAWNGAANFLNSNVIGNVNKVVGAFGVKIPNLPRFARGGIVPGGTSKRDNMVIAARSGEGVLIPETVDKLGGASGIKFLNDWGRGRVASGKARMHGESPLGGIPGFAEGGVVGWVKQVGSAIADKVEGWMAKGAGWALDKILAPVGSALRSTMPNGFTEDYTVGMVNKWRTGAKAWGDKQGVAGGGAPGSGIWSVRTTGWPARSGGWNSPPWTANTNAAAARIRAVFPGQSTGSYQSPYRWSDHYPKAVDHMTNAHTKAGLERGNAIVNYLQAHANEFGLRYLIWNKKITSGGGWTPYSVAGQGDHSNHVHASYYDRGGPLRPGFTAAFNGTGQTEIVRTAEQMLAMSRAINAGGYAAQGLHATTLLLSRMDSRIARLEDRLDTGSSSGSTFNFYGDLSFPNIKNGNDADEFIKNLEALARSK